MGNYFTFGRSHRRDCQVLLRMISSHLEERPTWKTALFAEIKTAADAAFNPSTFSESLDATLHLQERNYPNEKIPIILPFLADGILVPGGTKCEGIFHVPGDSDLVSQLKLRIDRGYYTLENVDDPHMLASLLKLWLRELCDPSSPRSSTTTASMQDLIHLLVSLSRVVLFVMSFLQLFLEEKALARLKMTATNMALVLSPNLLGCSPQSMTVVFMNAQFKQTFVYNLLSAMELMKTMYHPLHPNLVSPNLAIGDEADIGLHQDLLGLHS
ncbi:Rho GTPase activation protein [Pisolithus marmoratus]|nr:Rho GTPase activation protein [Pisolithus marmoratus]